MSSFAYRLPPDLWDPEPAIVEPPPPTTTRPSSAAGGGSEAGSKTARVEPSAAFMNAGDFPGCVLDRSSSLHFNISRSTLLTRATLTLTIPLFFFFFKYPILGRRGWLAVVLQGDEGPLLLLLLLLLLYTVTHRQAQQQHQETKAMPRVQRIIHTQVITTR